MMTIYGYITIAFLMHCPPQQSSFSRHEPAPGAEEVHLSLRCPLVLVLSPRQTFRSRGNRGVRAFVCESRSKFGDGGGDVLQGGSRLRGGESLDGLQSLVAMVTA